MTWIRGSLAALGLMLLAVILGAGVAMHAWLALGAVVIGGGIVASIVRSSNSTQIGAFLLAGGFGGWAFTSDSTLFGSSFSDGSVSSSPAKQIPVVVMTLGLLLCYLPTEGRREIFDRFRGQAAIRSLGYYAVAVLIAAAFSPIHSIAYLRAAQMLIPVAALLALNRKNPHIGITLAITACVVHSSLGILFPQDVNGGFGVERISGYLQVNTYAFAGAVSAVTGTWFWIHRQRRGLAVLLLALGITAIVTARSRTALVAGVVAVLVTMYTARRSGPGSNPALIRITQTTLIGSTALACYPGGVFGSWGETLGQYFARGNAGDVMTFTGRERLWALAIRMTAERPVVGYGPGSLRAGHYAELVINSLGYGGQGHNAAVGAYFETGILGLGAWLAVMIFTFNAIRRTRHFSRPLLMGLFALISFSAMTEAGPSGFGLFWATLLGLAASASGTAGHKDSHVPATMEEDSTPPSCEPVTAERFVVART